MNNIEFIYFDIGGVLVDWSRAFQTAANTFNLTIKDIDNVFEENHDKITKGLISSQEFWQRCIKKYQLKNAVNFDFVTSWVSDYQPLTQVHNFIRTLESKYKIGLLSNIYKGMLSLLLKNGIIPNIKYNQILFSCDIGMMKPNLDIYKYAQQKAVTEGNKILLVDDRLDFLTPAKQLGWQTFLFENININKSIKELKKKLED